MSKIYTMRNDVDRVVNDVQFGQVISVTEDRLEYYTDLGFIVVNEEEAEEQTAEDAEDESDDIKARKQFLQDHGINVGANRKEATIIAKSNEAGYGDETDELE